MSLKYYAQKEGDLDISGLSSDTKPVSPITGWTFFEDDTGKTFRAESGSWVEKTNSSYSTSSHNHAGVYAPVLGGDDNYVTNAEKTKLSNISVTQAVDLDTIETNANNVPAIKTKTDNITVTQAVNLDTIESDTATNNTKVSNATHTGDATGATALTVVKIQGKDFPTLGAGDDQKYPKYVSASNAFVMTAIAGGGDVVGQASSVDSEIALFSGTGGKTIKRDTTTGVLKAVAGVIGAAVAGTDYGRPYVHVSTSSGATTTGADVNPVSVSGAVFTYVNNAVYRIWVMGRIDATAATTGCGIQFDFSTAITDINAQTIHPLTTATPAITYTIADDTTVAPSTGVPAGPLDVPFNTVALFRPGNNTGTCQLRFRSETTAVTALMAGVTMVVERLA